MPQIKDTCIPRVCWSKGHKSISHGLSVGHGWMGAGVGDCLELGTDSIDKRQEVSLWIPRGCRSCKPQARGEHIIIIKGTTGVRSLRSNEILFKEWALYPAELREYEKLWYDSVSPLGLCLALLSCLPFLSLTLVGQATQREGWGNVQV